LHQRALLFRDEESLELKERPRMLLLCEWIARLHVIGQRGRDVVLNGEPWISPGRANV